MCARELITFSFCWYANYTVFLFQSTFVFKMLSPFSNVFKYSHCVIRKCTRPVMFTIQAMLFKEHQPSSCKKKDRQKKTDTWLFTPSQPRMPYIYRRRRRRRRRRKKERKIDIWFLTRSQWQTLYQGEEERKKERKRRNINTYKRLCSRQKRTRIFTASGCQATHPHWVETSLGHSGPSADHPSCNAACTHFISCNNASY